MFYVQTLILFIIFVPVLQKGISLFFYMGAKTLG